MSSPGNSTSSPMQVVASPSPARYYYSGVAASDEGLLESWRIIRRHAWTLAGIVLLAATIGLLITIPQTPVYQARASLEIQDVNQNFLDFKQMLPVNESKSVSELTDIQTQIKLLQSETAIRRSLSKMGALKPKTTQGGGRLAALRRALSLPERPSQDPAEQAIRATAAQLRVRAATQTRIVELLYDDSSPKFAADFLNTLANEFIEENMEARWQMAQRTGDWLRRQLEEMRIKLEQSEGVLQTYARRASLTYTADNANSNLSEAKLRQLQTELSKAEADRAAKQSRFEAASQTPIESLPSVLDDPTLRSYQATLTDLRRQHDELSTMFTPEYPKIQRLQAQISSVEGSLAKERAVIVARLRHEYDEALRLEKLLVETYTRQALAVNAEAARAIQYNILRREVESNRQLYEDMLQRVKVAGFASALRASNIRIVDPAVPPSSPYKPSAFRNVALAVVAGLFAGAALVIVRSRSDRVIRSPGDVGFHVNVPELGVIPAASASFSVDGQPRLRPLTRALLPSPAPRNAETQLALRPPHITESFRSLLTSVLLCDNEGAAPRVLVITSAMPGEGKSIVTSNLGIALAEAERKTLLIDADLRKPRLHEIFGLDNERGLGTLLAQDEHCGVGDVAQATGIEGLHVLTAGPPSEKGPNLLYSGRLRQLLTELRRGFDTVLIDTPPLFNMADARILGHLADSVVLVVRAGRTTLDAVLTARQRLDEDSIQVLGVVLNDWNSRYARRHFFEAYPPMAGKDPRKPGSIASRG